MSAIPNTDADKLHAEIGKMLAETARALQEIRESTARTAKAEAETTKLRAESKWHPVVVAAGLLGGGALFAALTGAVVAITKMIGGG